MTKSERTVVEVAFSSLEWLQQQCDSEPHYADGYVLETTWSKELTQVFNSSNSAVHQKRYPSSRQTCDVICQLGEGAELWLEIKGAWLITRPFVTEDGESIGGKRNPSYKKHLFHPDESTLKDLAVKLGQITGAKKYLAVLLIGFDSVALPMDNEIVELSNLADLAISPWTQIYRGWSNSLDSSYRIRCWFWYRPAALVESQNGDSLDRTQPDA